MRTLVLGLGNPLLKDDSIGLRVIRALRPMLEGKPGVDVEEDYHGGLRLMEHMIGYKRVIIIDAIRTGSPPGTLHQLGPHDVPTQRSASAHDVNLTTALAVGREAGAALPRDKDILLVGVEALEVETFGEDLTPQVEAAIPAAVQMVLAHLGAPS